MDNDFNFGSEEFSFDDILSEFGADGTEEPVQEEYQEEASADEVSAVEYTEDDYSEEEYSEPEEAEEQYMVQEPEDEFEFGFDEIASEKDEAESESSDEADVEPEAEPDETPADPYDLLRKAEKKKAPGKKASHGKMSKADTREAQRLAKARAKEEAREAREQEKLQEKLARDREKREARESRREERAAALRYNFQERRKGRIGLIVLAAVLALVIAGAVLAGVSVTKSNLSMPNLYIASVSVGRMTREQTTQALLANGWQERTDTPLKVTTYGNVSFDVNPLQAGAVLSADSAADVVMKYGHDRGPLENLYTYITSYLKATDLNNQNTAVNADYINSLISNCTADLAQYLGDGNYTLDTSASALKIMKGAGSMSLDTAGLFDEIVSALATGRTELYYDHLNRQPVMPDFDAIHTELSAEPRDASFTDDGKFNVIDEIIGCAFAVEDARRIWEDTGAGEIVSIPVKMTYPAVTGDSLRNMLYRDLLGTMTTYYNNSTDNRKSNVRLATSKINGFTMYPGDVFAYNTVVGARTEEGGFLPAPAYVNGDVKDEIGGGACQVSSTLYSACLFADMLVIERECHYYQVSYMQVGTDATVTIPDEGRAIDYKFQNQRNFPIKIVGYTEEREDGNCLVTFEIWGTREEGDYIVNEFKSMNYGTGDFDRVLDENNAAGGVLIELTHETWGFEDDIGPGKRTLTHRIVYAPDGSVIEDDIVNAKLANGNYGMDTYYFHNT